MRRYFLITIDDHDTEINKDELMWGSILADNLISIEEINLTESPEKKK